MNKKLKHAIFKNPITTVYFFTIASLSIAITVNLLLIQKMPKKNSLINYSKKITPLSQIQKSQNKQVNTETTIKISPPNFVQNNKQKNTNSNNKNYSIKDKINDILATTDKNNIIMIQKILKKNGYNVKVDGVIGAKTKKAIKDFQAKNNMQPNGKISPDLIAKIHKLQNK